MGTGHRDIPIFSRWWGHRPTPPTQGSGADEGRAKRSESTGLAQLVAAAYLPPFPARSAWLGSWEKLRFVGMSRRAASKACAVQEG